jgi:hypothetical protein
MSIMKLFSTIETVVQSPLPSSSLQPPPSSSLQPSNEESTPYENEEQVMSITEKTRKRKRKAHEKFAAALKAQTGLDLHSARDGHGWPFCKLMRILFSFFWRKANHHKECHGKVDKPREVLPRSVGVDLAPEKLSPEAQAFVLRCMAGGDKHRKKPCDATIKRGIFP